MTGSVRRHLHGPSRWVVALCGLASVGALLVLSYVAIRLSSDAARDHTRNDLASAASASAVAVEQEMSGLVDLVASYADRPSMAASLGTGDPARVDRDTVRFHLGELDQARRGIDLAFVADPRGVLIDVLPVTPSIVGQDFSFRDWYRGVVATGRPYVSTVYATAAAGDGLVVAAAAPIHDATSPGSPMVGILVAGYRLDTIQRFVDDFAAAHGVTITVTDQRGVLVASPGAAPSKVVSRRADPRIAAALAGESGTAESSRAGERVITAYVPIEGLGWTLTAEVPSSVALGEFSELRAGIVAVTAILGLVLMTGLVVLDRTLRRRAVAEEEARRSQAFLDSVVENIPHMVFVKDAEELRIVRFNRAGEDLLGCSREQMVGHNDHDLFPHEEAELLAAKDREVLDHGELVDIAAEAVQASDGRTRMLHTKKIPIFGSDGRPQYLLGISEDITERQAADAALEQARLDAHRANHAKSEFLSRMSHELRTPLNAVLGFGQLLDMDDLSAEQRDSVEHITKAGRHLLELIDEVLDISRIESGELRLSMEPVSLRDVVSDAVGMVRPLAAARSVRIIDGLATTDERHVRADRQRLKQVVVNLLANAVKYNREGGEVGILGEGVTDGRLRLVVTDTGIGIAEPDLARLFTPFERLGAEQSDVEGTGLGLTLTKQLVEAMGGQIGATSQPGVGSSFWVELPVIDAPAEHPQDVSQPIVASAPASIPARARSVLYVEDNLSNVKLVERIVAHRPEVTLIVAMQGRLALDLAREQQPSLILLDLHLPDMSGEEVLRRLRADPRNVTTPVVVLSADATTGQVQRLRANGANDYLSKPFDIPRLLALIDGTASAESEPPAEPGPGSGAPVVGPLDSAIVAALHQLGHDSEEGPAGLRDLVTTFLDESGSRLDELRIAVRDGDVASVERLAHSLAGSSGNLGARDAADWFRQVEARAEVGDLGDVPILLAHLGEAFTLAHAALRAEFLDDDDDGGDASP